MVEAQLEASLNQAYEHGFVTDVAEESFAPGLDESVIRRLSKMKNEPDFVLAFRLEAFRHWQTMTPPDWAKIKHEPIDFQAISYYSAPKSLKDGPKSLDEVDPELLRTYERLGIPLHEQKMLAGVAVDAVFDSVSVATTYKETLQKRVWFSAPSVKLCIRTLSWLRSI